MIVCKYTIDKRPVGKYDHTGTGIEEIKDIATAESFDDALDIIQADAETLHVSPGWKTKAHYMIVTETGAVLWSGWMTAAGFLSRQDPRPFRALRAGRPEITEDNQGNRSATFAAWCWRLRQQDLTPTGKRDMYDMTPFYNLRWAGATVALVSVVANISPAWGSANADAFIGAAMSKKDGQRFDEIVCIMGDGERRKIPDNSASALNNYFFPAFQSYQIPLHI